MPILSTLKKFANVFVVIAVAFLAITFPFSVKASVWGMGLLVVAAAISYLAYRKLQVHKGFLFLVLFFVIRLVAILLSDDVGIARIDTYLSFLVVPLAFMVVDMEKAGKKMFLAIFYGYLAICFYVVAFMAVKALQLGVLAEFLRNPKWYYAMVASPHIYWHTTHVACIFAFALPLTFYLHLSLKTIKAWVMWVGAIVVLLAVYFTGARTGIVISFVLLAFTYFFYFKRFGFLNKLLGAVFLLGAVAVVALHSSKITADSLRKVYLTLGVEAVKEHPIKGSGLLSSKKHLQQYDADNGTSFSVNDYFHNQFIDDWVQFGIVGLLLLLSFWFYCAWLAFRRRDYLMACFIIIFIPFMMFDYPLGMKAAKGIVPFAFWLCLFLAHSDNVLSAKSKDAQLS